MIDKKITPIIAPTTIPILSPVSNPKPGVGGVEVGVGLATEVVKEG
jgi:hypothetical protein